MFGTSETPGRARLLASIMLAVTFAAGALAGAAGERVLRARQIDQKAPSGPGPLHRGSVLLEPGTFDLIRATPEQREELQALLAERDSQTVAIWSEVEPKYRQVFEDARKEIRGVLSADQKVTLDSLIDARRERWRQNRENRYRDRCPAAGADTTDSGKSK